MARSKSNGVNKSQAIRDALAANPKAKSREIVADLAAKRIKPASRGLSVSSRLTWRRGSSQANVVLPHYAVWAKLILAASFG